VGDSALLRMMSLDHDLELPRARRRQLKAACQCSVLYSEAVPGVLINRQYRAPPSFPPFSCSHSSERLNKLSVASQDFTLVAVVGGGDLLSPPRSCSLPFTQ